MVILELRQKATMADFLIKNYNELDENAIQELIEFAEMRGGFFREDLKRVSIRKRASIEYLQAIFKGSGIEVQISEALAPQRIIAGQRNMPPREAEETVNFGKHKGEKWGDLPTEYLMWIKASMQGYNADIAKAILFYRKEQEIRDKTDPN